MDGGEASLITKKKKAQSGHPYLMSIWPSTARPYVTGKCLVFAMEPLNLQRRKN